MSLSIWQCSSPTNTQTHANSCLRQEHERPSYRGDRDTNLHGYHLLHFPPISGHSSFPFYNYNFRSPFPLAFLESHAYISSVPTLV